MKHSFVPQSRPRRSPIRRCFHALALVAVAVLLASIATRSLSAQTFAPDSIRRGMDLLFVGSLNFDAYPDTVWGVGSSGTSGTSFSATGGGYLPRAIVWGRPTSGKQGAGTPGGGQLHPAYTLITYSGWSSLGGSVALGRFNVDSVGDLFVTLRGKVQVGTTFKDSARMCLLFGQSGLDTIASLDLGAIVGFHYEHFIAMEVRRNAELIHPAMRDLSGATSWEFPPVAFTFNQPDTTHHTTPTTLPASVRVYPNPAGISANVEARTLEAGTYGVEVVATNGAVVLRQDVEVTSGDFLRTLDVARLASGYYVVRLVQGGRLVGNYPIVVTR